MIAREIISTHFTPVLIGEEGETALRLMSDQWVKHIPVIDQGKLVGVLAKEALSNADLQEKIDSHVMNIVGKYVNAEDHFLEVLKHMTDHKLTAIPVVMENMNYIGTITQEEMMLQLANTDSMSQQGSLLVLEMKKQDYSLADIAHIVENEGSAILNVFITPSLEKEKIEVSIKINTQYLSSILASFERHDYIIKASYEENDYTETLRDRYEGLMSYLNI